MFISNKINLLNIILQEPYRLNGLISALAANYVPFSVNNNHIVASSGKVILHVLLYKISWFHYVTLTNISEPTLRWAVSNVYVGLYISVFLD